MYGLIEQSGTVAENRVEAIDRILSLMSLSDDITGKWVQSFDTEDEGPWDKQKTPIRYFDHVQPMAYESLLGTTKGYDREFLDWEDPELRAMPMQWDVCYLTTEGEGRRLAERAGKTYMYSVQRIRTVPMSELRGVVKFQTGKLAEMAQCFLFSDGTYCVRRIYIELRGGVWVGVAAPGGYGLHPYPIDDSGNTHIWLSKSMGLTCQYDWMVDISYSLSQMPSLRIPTDPIGGREIFKLRELPEGKSRRDALKHWVSGHWRTRGKAPDELEETEILPYLRGRSDFRWQGLECHIEPSQYDIRRAERFEQARKQRKAS